MADEEDAANLFAIPDFWLSSSWLDSATVAKASPPRMLKVHGLLST